MPSSPIIKLDVPDLPAALQTCQQDPELPDNRTLTQPQVAQYLVQLWGAWHDCHSTVQAQVQFWRAAKEGASK